MSELPSTVRNREVIRENQRFATYKALYDGQSVFVKQIRHEKLGGAVRSELWGLEAFAQLQKTASLPFSVPRVLLNGEDYIITEWVEGEQMAMSAETAHFLAASYAAIDKATQLVHPPTANFALPGKDGHTTLERLQLWLKKVNYQAFFDQDLIDGAFQYLKTNLPLLEARLTHADFTPSNVLVSGRRKVLIDYESVSLLWPRFYDVVNLTFNRFVLEPELTEYLQLTVKEFFALIGSSPEDNLSQLNTIAMVRALSTIAECMTEPDDYHNTIDTMTPEIAARLTDAMRRMSAGELYFSIVTRLYRQHRPSPGR
jgi:aminoglycoside phosphotransferase (APT) family kinase protein